MKNRLTSFRITTSVKYLEIEILKATGYTQAAFHRKMIDDFLKGDTKIEEDLKITRRSDPRYVKKSFTEQIYLDSIREQRVKDIAKRENTKKTIVLFQALMNYCLKYAGVVQEDVVKNIIDGNYKIEK